MTPGVPPFISTANKPMTVTLNAETSGQGPALFLLHGLFGSAANFRSVARQLSASHQVHVLDLRNHGASPWAEGMAYEQMADDLLAYLDAQGLRSAAVLGHSMGGKAAMALALRAPDRVSRLLVVDIAPVAYAHNNLPVVQAMQAVDLAGAASRSAVQQQLQPLLPDPAVAPFLVQNLVSRDGGLAWRLNLAAIGEGMPQILDFSPALRQQVYPGPVTAIVGARSTYVVPAEPGRFAPMFPHTDVQVIDGAGHWVHADQPQAFLAAVQQALA